MVRSRQRGSTLRWRGSVHCDEMAASARAGRASAAGAPVRERRAAFMRYVGPGPEIAVEPPNRRLTAADIEAFAVLRDRLSAPAFERPIQGAAIEVLAASVLANTEPRNPRASPR